MLVLANKQDLPGARDPQEIEKLLGLNELTAPPLPGSAISVPTSSSQHHSGALNKEGGGSGGAGTGAGGASGQFKGWVIQPACAITGEGLNEGLDALYEMILKRRKILKGQKKRVR